MRNKLLSLLVAAGSLSGGSAYAAEAIKYVEQGWEPELREAFYHTPQGSRLMPLSWFLELQRSDGAGRFADAASLAAFGFLPPDGGPTELNKHSLPVGFAVEPIDDGWMGQPDSLGTWVGLTCAACHTGNVSKDGITYRVDGAPAMLDFDEFYVALNRAVQETILDNSRRGALLGAVAAREGRPPSDIPAIGQAFAGFAANLQAEGAVRRTQLAAGHGRLDALTHIGNSLSVLDLGEPLNIVPPAAPTSYPPLWLAPSLTYVQWAPIAASPIDRNIAEVLGVFGQMDLRRPAGQFESSVRVAELVLLEDWVRSLSPPRWQVAWGFDEARAIRGQAIFKDKCADCHNMPISATSNMLFDKMTERKSSPLDKAYIKIKAVNVTEVETDPTYLQALGLRRIKTGALKGIFGGAGEVAGGIFLSVAANQAVNAALTSAGISEDKLLELKGFGMQIPDEGGSAKEHNAPRAHFESFKAGPLMGVWATAPYLHNGSVPTIFDLLSLPEERPAAFWVGGVELDTANLGFVSSEGAGPFHFDTRLRGNGNMGHRFPETPLSTEQKLDVIEYLKDPLAVVDKL